MVSLAALWLPILLSAVFVFIVSSIIHMAIPIHKGDYKKMDGEDAIREVMRGQNLTPGQYMMPAAHSMKEVATPEMAAKFKEGPVGYLTIVPNGQPSMGKALILWFLYCLLIGLFSGYMATICLSAGAHYMDVFRVVGTAAILGYALGHCHESIWKGLKWSITIKFIIDGVIYALVTAGTFGWLWPAA